MTLLEHLQGGVVVLDGAMGTVIQGLGLTDADFGGPEFRMLGDLLTFSRPEVVEEIHLAYYRAGCHAVETNTFGASPFRLGEYDFRRLDTGAFAPNPYGLDLRTLSCEEMARALSRAAAEVACRARERYRSEAGFDGRPLYVFGSIGPSNRVLSATEADLPVATFDAVEGSFYHQVRGLLEGGVDALLYETQQDVLELKAALLGGFRAMEETGRKVPVIAQVTVDPHSRMQIFHTDVQAALVTVGGMGIDAFGINCSIGPDLMARSVEKLSRYSPLPISVVPNAGLPLSEGGRTVFPLTPAAFAGRLGDFVAELGVTVVGGCCGTTPEHIAALAEAVRGLRPAPRCPRRGLYVSGPQEAVLLDSSATLVMIGERLNVRGSRKVRLAVEGGGPVDHAALEEVVSQQVRDLGLKVLDVCMDSNVVDTTETLKEVIRRHTVDFPGAMCLDSFSLEALVEAVKVYPGRPILNSISLEEVEPGVTKAEALIRATRAHHPVYIGLATGPEGPAATREQKVELARRLVEIAGSLGVEPASLLVDMNVFPVGSEAEEGVNFALESLEAIPGIKALHPDLGTVCGVGNLTTGLGKKPHMRKVLTSVWLDEARKRGLDAAILNPEHYVFVRDLDPDDYELGLRVILERDMEAYQRLEEIASRKRGAVVARRAGYDELEAEEAVCRRIKEGHKERRSGRLEFRGHSYAYRDAVVLRLPEVLERREPLEFVNDFLLPAMNELGDAFGRGDVSLPHLLRSADVLKQVMGFLEEYLRICSGADLHAEVDYRGTVVLGTVYQDVHSIGKDLARTLLENYGYRVIDLGVMTPLQRYLDAAVEHGADAIGMSALLVQTANHMITVSRMLEEQNLAHLPLLIGGAPVNERHAAFVALAGRDEVESMRANVFYCPTAMDGVTVMNRLTSGNGLSPYLEENRRRLQEQLGRARRKAEERGELLRTLPRREIPFEGPPLQEWLEPRRVEIRLRDFAPRLDTRTLFALNWKFGGRRARDKRGETGEHLLALLEEWVERCDREGWIRPMGLYGLFPCWREGEEVVVFDPREPRQERCRFRFAVVVGAGRRDTVCAADYFRPRGTLDTVGVVLATSGPQVDAQLARFREEGDSEATLLLGGLSDRVSEDMAQHLHDRVRRHLGLGPSHGIRWSPGYPALPDAENNLRILELLKGQEHLGVRATAAGEFSPTGTTAALICFHPRARYT